MESPDPLSPQWAASLERAPRTSIGRPHILAIVLALIVAASTAASAAPSAPAPASARTGPQIGVQYHGLWTDWSEADGDRVLDLMVAAGARWVRLDVGWTTLFPDGPDEMSDWYLRRVEGRIDAARKRGLRVLVTFWATPGWANGGREENVAPDDPQDYARAVAAVAGRLRGKVAAWEVWNEPNHDRFLAGEDPDVYARLLRAAGPAIRAADPAALVVLGGPSYNDTGWLAALYERGVRGSFDVLATHPYPSPADAPPTGAPTGRIWELRHVEAVRALMLRNGDRSPVWFTEIGWSTHANGPDTAPWDRGVSPREQARNLVATIRIVRARYPYVTALFWYTARDLEEGDAQQDGYGLLTRDLHTKPAWRAMRAELVPTLDPRRAALGRLIRPRG